MKDLILALLTGMALGVLLFAALLYTAVEAKAEEVVPLSAEQSAVCAATIALTAMRFEPGEPERILLLSEAQYFVERLPDGRFDERLNYYLDELRLAYNSGQLKWEHVVAGADMCSQAKARGT